MFAANTSNQLKFFRKGLPFFTIVIGGAFGLYFFQQVRYDFRKNKRIQANCDTLKDELSQAGFKVKKNVTVESILKEVEESDTENWENIRGPREFEDNSQFIEAKKRREQELQRRREALKLVRKKEEV